MSDWSWEKLLFEKEQEIAKLEKRLEWISVDDRLPALEHYIEDDMPTWSASYVLCYGNGHISIGCYDPDRIEWFDPYNPEIDLIVTHWMPLSPPPEVE